MSGRPGVAGRRIPGLRSAFGLACLAAVLLCASCGRPTKNQAVPFLIGVSQANLTEPWRVAMTEEIRKEAAQHPELRMIYADATDSSSRQVSDVQRLMGYGIDLLIVSPTDSRALTPVVRDAHNRIPVIVLDRDVEGYDYSLFIGPDNERLGREAGAVAAKLLGPKGGNVLEIEGRSGSPPSLERNQGFRESIEAKPGTKLLPPIVADWLRDKAEDEIANRVAGLPRVDVVFAQNDAMAYGAWKSFQAAGRKGTKFIGSDGLAGPMGGLDLVDKGILAATFTCPTGGKEAVIYGMDLLLHKEGIPKKIYLRPRKVTRDELARSGSGELYTPRLVTGMDRPIVLGFAQVGSESEWRVANTKSIKNAAAKAGIELLFEDGRQQQANEISAIRSFIKRKVDVIAFSPVVESGWDEVLSEARAAGIPVILTDRSVSVKDNSLWLSFMGSDFLEEGREAARWIIGATRTSEAVNIVELQGTIGSAPAIDRAAGFKEVLKDFPNYRIIASESGDFFKEQGYAVMKSILSRTYERIDAVFAHNDDMAIGAIKAMEEAGLKPGKEITVVSIDAAHGAFMAMINGTLSCTIECNPLLGPQLMKAVQDYVAGKDLPIRMITSEGIFPAATARRDMIGREY